MAAPHRHQARQRSLEMGGERFPSLNWRLAACDFGSASSETNRAAPFVEYIEHVGLAEIDPHWAAARPLRIVAFEVAIDPGEHDFQRDTGFGPPAHAVEGGTDDANEMSVVLAGEIRLDVAAVFVRVHNHSTSPPMTRSVDPPDRTSSAPSPSMPAVTPRSLTPSLVHSTAAPAPPTARSRQRPMTAPVCPARSL